MKSKKGLNVLSLFDGLSCGQIALNRIGIKPAKYYAAEIDKYAITVTQANYPDTIQLGDVTKWREWDIDWASIDLVGAGFPCQAWSVAGQQLGDKDERGMLFWTTLEIIAEVLKHNPKAKFLIENVKMKKEFEEYITHHTTEALGCVEKTLINSALVSAQNRNRYYWTNFKVEQPEDKSILLKDVLEDESAIVGAMRGRYLVDGIRQDGKTLTAGKTKQYLEIRNDEKSNCLTTVQKNNIVIRDKSKCVRSGGRGSYDRHEWDSVDKDHTIKLTPLECERLQTVPDNYTAHVSNTQRYKMLGNGWTVDVIAHIFNSIESANENKAVAKAIRARGNT